MENNKQKIERLSKAYDEAYKKYHDAKRKYHEAMWEAYNDALKANKNGE
jgi:hypothetical protein